MRLSVCMIARNEAPRLEAAIASVRAVADEIIVTDTGSTDGTPELAARLGARVNHFEWSDDFAAARNACQAHAKGEWILWLDADERLKAGSDELVRRAIGDGSTMAWQVIREDFFAHDRADWFSEMYQLRLVRRDLPCRWIGRIHEHLAPAPTDLVQRLRKSVRISQIRLQHWGYTSERMPEKTRRAAHLCELELAERPGQLYYLVELSRALLTLNDPRGVEVLVEAARIMMAARHAQRPPSPLAAMLIEELLALRRWDWASEEDLLELAERWFPKCAPLAWAGARTRAQRADWPGAERDLRRLITLIETSGHDRIMSFDPRIGEDARVNLGVALVRQGRLREAQEVFESLLSSDRRAAEARANLDAITRLREQFGDPEKPNA
jgi:hypothetical protein